MLPFSKILCPVDFSAPSFRALLKSAEIARHCGGELYLLHVISPLEAADTAADEAIRDLRHLVCDYLPESLGAHSLVSAGDATAEILRVAGEKSVDLIVMATHGSTGWREFALGSVTDEVVRLAPCPVLTLNDAALGQEKENPTAAGPGGARGVADMASTKMSERR
ncbi:MAG TPA: universal stress protein [Abditibacteriaceae bacterium]|nr:universal stress protein [Abditibacteriaceae bacterium]